MKSRAGGRANQERKAFALRLRVLRQSYGLNIDKPRLSAGGFAALLELEGETYRRYERGETEPSIRVLTRIHVVTGANLNNLVAGEIDRTA